MKVRDRFKISAAKDLLREASDILEKEKDLNQEKKRLREIFRQVGFLYGKNDEEIEQLCEVLEEVANSDFSGGVPHNEANRNEDIFALGLNMINEELEQKAFKKNIIYALINALDIEGLVIVTDSRGSIKLLNNQMNILSDYFSEEAFYGEDVKFLFKDFDKIKNNLDKEDKRNISLILKIPDHQEVLVNVDVAKVTDQHKMEALVYIVRLKAPSQNKS